MSSGHILIADDEPSVRDSVGYALAQEGFEVTPAADGDEATAKLGDGIPFDLLILDIMMPGPSGLDICRDVRSRSAVPIIVLTAKDAEVEHHPESGPIELTVPDADFPALNWMA